MPRYKLTIEYDGTGLMGWQRQAHGPSVQQYLEEAIKKFCGQPIEAFCCGRTDAGVHALGQVAHIDLEREEKPFTVMQAINFHLQPQRIVVVESEAAQPDFHARFSATRRHYRYRILNRRARPALEESRVWHIPTALNVEAMQEAAQVLVGHHDFTTFRSSECQGKSPEKTLDGLEVKQAGDEVHLTTHSRSFLHHQVRNMTGSLAQVGLGKWNRNDLRTALEARDRKAGGPTAPAEGLYFLKVDYD